MALLAHSGDLVVVFYSGHGGQTFDVNGDEKVNDPSDILDETWCLYDRQLIDDELHSELLKFRKGVRVLVLSDSCYSGTMTKGVIDLYSVALSTYSDSKQFNDIYFPEMLDKDGSRISSVPADNKPLSELFAMKAGLKKRPVRFDGDFRLVPFERSRTWEHLKSVLPSTVVNVWASNRAIYEEAERNAVSEQEEVTSSVLLLSACQDNQQALAPPGLDLSLFTYHLEKVWAKGAFSGDYLSLTRQISSRMPPSQTPNLTGLGTGIQDFIRQRPFKVKEQ